MNALDFARRSIVFDESSPITGRFDSSKYRFLEKPLLSLSDIRIKRTVVYKASSCLGTVFLQIALAYRLDQCAGNCYFIGSTQNDAGTWSTTRGKKWIERIPSLRDTMSNEKYAVTKNLFQWPHKWLEIQGPGENAQQGRQCAYLFTDESHVDEWKEGAIASFEERTGKKWNAHHLHTTTSANEGKEVDRYYYQGGQNEFHLCCPKCHKLVWALWNEDAEREYNGERVFHYRYEDLSPTFICPHCSAQFQDTSRERFALHEGGDYVRKNLENLRENESFRWNCFAAWFMPWATHLAKFREAIEASKLGNPQPYENWIKKRLCQSYAGDLPDLGEVGASDYVVGSVWITEEEKRRFASFDVQDGSDGEGLHFWAQADEFERDGDSRRIQYAKLTTWAACKEFYEAHGVKHSDAYFDATGRRMREIFGKCEQWGCIAMIATDEDSFLHMEPNPRGPKLPRIAVRRPYSEPSIEDAYVGKATARLRRWKKIPPGYCIARRWSKPVIGGHLMALKQNRSRSYGIPKDINPEYKAQLNSYQFVNDFHAKSGVTKVILKQMRKADHSFSTSSMTLCGAIISDFFPLSEPTEQKPQLATA